MQLVPGTRLGPYEVISPLGAGGMGEVYRGRDTRLDRSVALKILPESFSVSPERRQRFEREARAVAALAHPNICALFDVGIAEGVEYLVMELLEGETLAARLGRGPLPLAQVLRYGREIAGALDAAHRMGVVHRDLKPGNVMLTASGAKLLDFGLAKLRPGGDAAPAAPFERPTEAAPLTAEGALLGTPHYMPPEQLEGREVDSRADIFALGAVLYEMATGKSPFSGDNQVSVIAAILSSEPTPISSLRPSLPPALARLIKVCLAKNPDERWQNAHDLMRELEWVTEADTQPTPALGEAGRARHRERLAWLAATTVLLIGLVSLLSRLHWAPESRQTIRFEVSLPEGATLYPFSGPVAISPDGRRLAFFLHGGDQYLLWVRPLDSYAAHPVPGTEGGSFPFWSPDSRAVGFFSQGKLKTIDLSGGPPVTVCDAPQLSTGAWGTDGVIVFGSFASGLWRVAAAGGAPTSVTTLDSSRHELGHLWPNFLPDGRHLLFLAVSAEEEQTGIYVGSLDGKETRRLASAGSNAAYAREGHLLFARNGALMAQRFDADRLEVSGEAFTIAEQVWSYTGSGGALFSVSQTGVLAFASPGNASTQLVWFDRGGRRLGAIGTPGENVHVDLSPDQNRVAFERIDPETGNGKIWLLDLTRDVTSRLSVLPSWQLDPVWSPDGEQILFGSNPAGPVDLYEKAASGAGDEKLLLHSGNLKIPTSWSPDGRTIVYADIDPKTGADLWVLPLTGGRTPRPFLQTKSIEIQGRVSPNGRWMAYASNESGRLEVYIQPFPGPGGKWQISSHGGSQPTWRRDGRELYYVAADGWLMAAPVKAGESFEVGAPEALFKTSIQTYFERIGYAATSDGQRFLINTRIEEATPPQIKLVVNWAAELRR